MTQTKDGPIPTSPRRRAWRTAGFVILVLWAFGVGIAIEHIWAYSVEPGAAATGPSTWPGSKLISPRAGSPTLVMFVHPQCPCSRASLEELRVALERAPRPVSAWVLFMRPENAQGDWEHTPLWQAATALANLHVVADKDGSEAARFGASTSGHAVFYDAYGRLAFSGGITASRGHVGDNAGLRRVAALMAGQTFASSEFPVFGCSLRDP